MKIAYQFSNLLGTVYHKGNLVFSVDGNSIVSPVGNRISIYDLKNNKSNTLPVESRFNYTAFDISPSGTTLIAVNDVGDGHIISLVSSSIIYKYNFKHPVSCLKFSPNGKFFAVGKGSSVMLFRTPGLFGKEFNPLTLEKTFKGFFDDVTCLDWSSDSRILIAGSKDATAKIFSLPKLDKFRLVSLGSHADSLVSVFFEEDSLDVTTISCNGRLCIWEANFELSALNTFKYIPPPNKIPKGGESDDEIDLAKGECTADNDENNIDDGKDEETESLDDTKELLSYKQLSKHYLLDLLDDKMSKLASASYHKPSHILVVGFTKGTFLILELPSVNLVHSLSVSNSIISQLAFNKSGDWIAVGCEEQGQLVVWEWQSETYIMNQQGHSSNISSLAYSSDGQYIVTGGEDGKVKLWNTSSGFCVVTFTDHTSCVSAVKFAKNKKFIASASLDGSVRAYDLTRYRNFRTLTSHKPVQFVSLAIDSSGEFIAAGGQDVFEIYLWSVKIGRLLEVISGHEGPVVSLDFNPSLTSTELVSVSWDKTLRIWNAIEATSAYESIRLQSEGLCVSYRPDGNEVVVSTLDGQISFFDVTTSTQNGFIEGRNDLGSGRSDTDLITAKKSQQAKAFTHVCYSTDGKYVLAGGQSKNICLYSVADGILLKKFEVTQNRSLDAVDDYINRRKMGEFGNIALLEDREEGMAAVKLPGVRKGDMAARKTKPEIRIFSLQFNPSGQDWAAGTTEGLLIYSLNGRQIFDPFQLEEGITPDVIHQVMAEQRYCEALMMALRLNEKPLLKNIFESIPASDIELCVSQVPEIYIEKSLTYLANNLESTSHIQFYLLWIKLLLTATKTVPMSTLITIQRTLSTKYHDLAKLCDYNKYTMQFLKRLGNVSQKEEEEIVENEEVR